MAECTCDPNKLITRLSCEVHGPAYLQHGINAEMSGMEWPVIIDPKVLEYVPPEDWAEGELWQNEVTHGRTI